MIIEQHSCISLQKILENGGLDDQFAAQIESLVNNEILIPLN